MQKHIQRYLAEVLGTYVLVFLGAGAVIGVRLRRGAVRDSASRCSSACTSSGTSRAGTSTRSSRSPCSSTGE